MKILVTGNYDPDYNRNDIILHGLQKLGHTIIEKPFNKKRLSRTIAKEIKEIEKDIDVVFMPSFTHVNVASVKRIIDKPLIFDPLISRYLSKVFDYKAVWKYSPRAYKNFLKDKISMNKADLVFADTMAHKKYFHSVIGILFDKIQVLPVGVNEENFFPKQIDKNVDTFRVGFYGSFIPLHGVDVIVETAKILEKDKDISFVILGDGHQFKIIEENIRKMNLRNIELKGWIDYKNLNDEINAFDMCLGIFGSSLKTNLVVPNKIYHYMACKKPVLTKDTEAIAEFFDINNDILVAHANPKEIAEKIQYLKENAEIRERIATTGFEKVIKNYNSTAIANLFIHALSKL